MNELKRWRVQMLVMAVAITAMIFFMACLITHAA